MWVVFGDPSLMGVMSACLAAGMNMSPVSRLKKTWSKVKTAKFDILEVSLKKKNPNHSTS